MTLRSRASLLSFLLLLSCKGNGVQGILPALTISPDSLKFPLIAFGTTAVQTVTLQSSSSADVTVSLVLSGLGASSYSLSPSNASTVPAFMPLPISVTFAPLLPSPIPSSAQTFDAVLTITSNDPTHKSTTINISGSAQAPELDLCWNQPPPLCLSKGALNIELGSLPPRFTDGGVVEIDLEDLTPVPLTVSELQLDAAAKAAGYAIEETMKLPITLSAQSGLTDVFHVRLTPLAAGPAKGNLVAISSDPRAGGQPVMASLDATVLPPQAPVACLGITEIDYLDGVVAAVDPSKPLAAQPAIQPPGPLDTVVLTALTSPTCSFDPQDGQNLAFQFGLAPPTGSVAQLSAVSGHPEEQKLQFDRPGLYDVSVKVTDSFSLTAMTTLDIPLSPQEDIEAVLTWPDPGAADLDLHLVRQLGNSGTASLVDNPQNDCFWCNCLLRTPSVPNYPSGSSGCNLPSPATQYPISLDWGATATPTTGNPLLVANQNEYPFLSENFDDARLTGPQPGATYGLYAHYYKAYQAAAADAGCQSDQDCTDPVYASCSSNECVPIADATMQVYVTGNNISDVLFDGGLQLTDVLRKPCDLWYAGEIQWISGGHFSDGGFAPAVFTFTPGDGGISNNAAGSFLGLTCPTF